MKIKNLTKAADRIRKAVEDKERIILYGDADMDGVSSVIILDEAIRSLGGSVAEYYFPDREKEGYGVNKPALDYLKKHAPALLVTMDLGISNFEEMPIAKKLGFDIVIIDHHKVLDKLPEADIIVDPKQPGDTYPFKEFAACGVTYQVAKELVGKKLSDSVRQSMAELAALGTIADMMIREEDNVKIIEEGLDALPYSWRPGIRAFLESEMFADLQNIQAKVQQMISVLNVRDTKDRKPGAFRLLTCTSLPKAKKMLEVFQEKTKLRKEQVEKTADEVRMRIFHKKEDFLVFEGGKDFDFALLGAVASIISQETQKPAFIYKIRKEGLLGSIRAPSGYDTVKAMQHCDQFLDVYGGHPQASGFQTTLDKREGLQVCLTEYFQKNK
jgi:single-stranded-DNA-specific exonuclease